MGPRRTTALVLSLAVTSSLAAGCNRGSGSESGNRYEDEIVIGWTPGDITGVYKTATNYFQEAARQANEHGFNVTVEYRAPQAHTDFGDQVAIIEDFVTRDVDAIAISPTDVEAVKPGIKLANEAGIPVILVNLLEEQSDIEVASYIGFDNSDAAEVSAYSILDYFGGPGVLGDGPKVDVPPDQYLDLEWWRGVYEDADPGSIRASGAIIEGIAGTFFSQERLNGFHRVIDEYPGIQILGEPIAADWNREKGIQAAETFMSRYSPNDMDFIWAASNEMGLGTMLTVDRDGQLDRGGKTPSNDDSVAVFTNDVTPESVSEIREGRLIAETHHGFAEWGWFGTKFAVQLACGQDAPQVYDIRPRTAWEGNADQFYPDMKLPPIDWEQIKADC